MQLLVKWFDELQGGDAARPEVTFAQFLSSDPPSTPRWPKQFVLRRARTPLRPTKDNTRLEKQVVLLQLVGHHLAHLVALLELLEVFFASLFTLRSVEHAGVQLLFHGEHTIGEHTKSA